MQYLTSEQAMADYAELITFLKYKLEAENSPVIGFGGSYGKPNFLEVCLWGTWLVFSHILRFEPQASRSSVSFQFCALCCLLQPRVGFGLLIPFKATLGILGCWAKVVKQISCKGRVSQLYSVRLHVKRKRLNLQVVCLAHGSDTNTLMSLTVWLLEVLQFGRLKER